MSIRRWPPMPNWPPCNLTPSLLPADLLVRLFKTVTDNFIFLDNIEITSEANPETVTREWCETVKKDTPIRRISLGAQSFQLKYLKVLERLASPESVRNAVKEIRRVGIDNINLDLIFAIPGQTAEEVVSDINQVKALDPKHISFYNLTLKSGHKLYSQLPDEDTAADLYERGMASLSELGYHQYEISNFSVPGFESKHNLLYWAGGDFLGVGPSSSSRFFWNGTFHHRKQFSDLSQYYATENFLSPPFEVNTLGQTQLEATFLELRKNTGVSRSEFSRRYQFDLKSSKKYELFLERELLIEEGDNIRLSPRGRMLADSVTSELCSN
jgi:oxygen-independent coproporphyrinogen-3 oxidase